MWYQQIADRAYQMQQASNAPGSSRSAAPAVPPTSFLARLPDEIYRALFFANYLVLVSLLYSIPFVGPVLSLLFFTWITAYYSFECVRLSCSSFIVAFIVFALIRSVHNVN